MAYRDKVKALLPKFCPKNSLLVTTPSIPHFNRMGSVLLDMETRGGLTPCGLPGGKFTEFYGENGCGKTAMACLAMREVQRQNGFAALISSEGIDNFWLTRELGVDVEDKDRFMYVEPHSLEAALQAIFTIIYFFHDKDIPVVIVLDSLSALTASEETLNQKNLGDTISAATGAKVCHRWLRSGVQYYLSGSKISVIIIRHLTQNPRPYGKDMTTHGSAFDYATWLRLKFTRKSLENSKKQQVGWWITLRCKKSKIGGIHNWSHSLPYYFGEGFDVGMEYISWLLDYCSDEYKTDENGRVALFGTNQFPSIFRKKFKTDEGFANELETLVYEKWLQLRGLT